MPGIQSRKEQNVGEGKTNMGEREMGSLDGQGRRGAAQGLFGDPSEVLARTVGEGVRKMMKEREG